MSVGASELLVEGEPSVEAIELVPGEVTARSPWQLFWRRFRADRVAMASGIFIVLLILVAIFAPLIVSILGLPGPSVQNPNLTDAFGTPIGPTGAHPFGVDPLGEDVMSRVIYGARVSLEVGIIGTALSTFLGVSLGLIAGFYRGWADTGLSRLADVVLSFPILLFGLGIGAACAVNGCLGGAIQPGVQTIIAIIVIAGWTYIYRITRGQVLSLREKEFVEAARSLGASNRRIMFREILPNLVAPIIVYSSLLIPVNILFEAALSYLGVGVKPPTASWGQMIADATSNFQTVWWYMLFPGVALLLTVLAFNLVGDGLQDALNPKADR
ncbi:MAG: ABC transporter permease [Solirubrobacterales bacterium]|nr:ABC transporter permease [Solirubrobacterales bacterium]MBV9798578.1 ABC transporter permease [Solirubrobacterales bacterium]